MSANHPESADGRPPVPLLASAFEPRHTPHAPLIRKRLLDGVTAGVRSTPLTLLSAPAGAGKTVLAATWTSAGAVSWRTSWLTADDACDQSARFWQYLYAALTRAGVRLRPAEPHAADGEMPTPFLMRLAADLLDLPQPAVLVLDTADRSLPAPIGAGLDFLIRHAHPRFRLVLCGRADPQLPLHRYRMTDFVTELRQEDLAFTVGETRELFTGCGVPISDEVARALTELTEGWVAGLHLAAASLHQGADAATLVDSLARQDGSVAEYLFAEVLDALPAPLRQLLLRTSICEELWPDLVDELTGRRDSRYALAALVRANTFVQRSATHAGCYRVHPLFRELLRAQLSYETPQDVAELHRRCAEWFAAAGKYAAAVDHAVAGEQWEHATTMLVEPSAIGSLLAEDECPYAAAARAIPPSYPGGEAALLRAASALRCGRRVAEHDLALVAGLAEQDGGTSTVRLSAAVVHGAVAAERAAGAAELARAHELVARAQQLVACEAERRPDDLPELSAVVAISHAITLLKTHGGGAATAAWTAALQAASSSRQRCTSLGGLALTEALHGRLSRAHEYGLAAEELADAGRVPRDRRPATAPLALAWVCCETLHSNDARRWAALAEESAVGYAESLVRPLLTILRGRLLRSHHDVTAAGEPVESIRTTADAPAWLRELDLIGLAARHIAADRPDEAMLIIDVLSDPHTPRAEMMRSRAAAKGAHSSFELTDVAGHPEAPLDVRVDAWVDSACRDLEQGQTAHAVAAAQAALKLAEPERLRRPFIQSSTKLRRLLRTDPVLSAAAGWLGQPAPTVVKLHRPAPRALAAPPAATAQLVEVGSLTDRETEVLRLLAELMSTEEIGAAMFVSVNTVRTHIRSILRKLAVSRRNEAVRRARELALV